MGERGAQRLQRGVAQIADCKACTVRVDSPLAAWLVEQGSRFSGPPQITRLAQWGSHVLMRAADPAGGFAVECFYTGLGPYTISGCRLP